MNKTYDFKIKDSRYDEKRKSFFLSLGLVIFALCVTGATYAYFALTASNNSLTGTVGGSSISLSVSKLLPTTQNTNMIPQLESTLGDAISSSYNCVDDHNNVICHVYKATVTNNDAATVELEGSIYFVGNGEGFVHEQFPNLKWMRLVDASTIGEYSSNNVSNLSDLFEESVILAPNASKDYYFVVWIDETGEIQNDSGTFNVTISFDSVDGDGLTSTVRPVTKLKQVKVGDYIAYTGNNGCPEDHCDGTNANYVDDTNMGYCSDSGDIFNVNGWRIMAKDSGGVYIVSAGAPECMCTNADGTTSDSNYCSSYVSGDALDIHINNLNAKALTYCNMEYAKGGICDETTAWAMADADYQRITGSTLSACSGVSSEACGLNKTLINNGGDYWFATQNLDFPLPDYFFNWYSSVQIMNNNCSDAIRGVRPVLYLDSNSSIDGGDGSYDTPYTFGELPK